MNNHLDIVAAPNLLTIPGEIRNYIYELTLPKNKKSRITGYKQTKIPPLCQTSRQIRRETLPIWRASTHFRVDNYEHFATLCYLKDQAAGIYNTDTRLKAGFEHVRHLHWSQAWLAPKGLHELRRCSYKLKVVVDVESNDCRIRVELPPMDLSRKNKRIIDKAWHAKQPKVARTIEGLLGRELTVVEKTYVRCPARW
ncbi:hypothetical protein LTR37_001609 [Vermiconidia calcicola]|uniref:Uncharacterized protein n=1 Tax=Vermiconidia calcicola TaxID=1690605 RepID=A0ACC3NVP7_9PEZI|nr:hypothetical protein LTR37_001609 [Vermiconidia calcicola]